MGACRKPHQDSDELKQLAREALLSIAEASRHVDIDTIFPKFGVPAQRDHEETKSERAMLASKAVGDNCDELLRRILRSGALPGRDLAYQIEEVLWRREAHPTVLERTRREIAKATPPTIRSTTAIPRVWRRF
jgi:hypothetical protein